MTDPKLGLWRYQFGDDYDVPLALSLDARLRDVSWGNDACPSFMFAAHYDSLVEDLPRLWVEHITPELREGDSCRYAVTVGDDTLYTGDDLDAALAVLLTRIGDVCHECKRPGPARLSGVLCDECQAHEDTLPDPLAADYR